MDALNAMPGDAIDARPDADDVHCKKEWTLPADYRARETAIAFANIMKGIPVEALIVSRNTRHAAIQHVRECVHGFGRKFRKDPRAYSSPRVWG